MDGAGGGDEIAAAAVTKLFSALAPSLTRSFPISNPGDASVLILSYLDKLLTTACPMLLYAHETALSPC